MTENIQPSGLECCRVCGELIEPGEFNEIKSESYCPVCFGVSNE